MKPPNNRSDNAQLDILRHQVKPPVPWNRLYLVESLAKGIPGNPQTSQTIFKAIDCSPQLDER